MIIEVSKDIMEAYSSQVSIGDKTFIEIPRNKDKNVFLKEYNNIIKK